MSRPPASTAPDSTGGPAAGAPALDAADQELILEHFRRPHGKGTLPTPDAQATASNPLCGESVTVTLSLDRREQEPRLADIRFSSDGCSISQASASMMTDLVRGEPLSGIRSRAEALRAMLRGDRSDGVMQAVGPLRVFGGVARLPARVACALLPWEAMAAALPPQTGFSDRTSDRSDQRAALAKQPKTESRK